MESLTEKKVIYIDIDEKIARTTESRDYTLREPNEEKKTKANKLYEQGHIIVQWTARGTVTGIDWRDTTEKQFEKWGVLYHDLKFGKPNYDLFIDDKNLNTDDWV